MKLKAALIGLIAALASAAALAQIFNPVQILVSASSGHESVFDNNGNPWNFFATTPAINYDLGGQGIAYNVTPSSCNAGSSYRSDAVNFKVSTYDSLPFEIGCTNPGTLFKTTITIGQACPCTITMWLGSQSAGGSWDVLIDGVKVANVATPNTGSYETPQPSTSGQFNVAQGSHVITFAYSSGDSVGVAGDFFQWQGSQVGTGTIPGLANGAGFTTLVQSDDFTQPFYANQSNWLNCNPNGAFSISNPRWHHGYSGFGTQLVAPCSDISQQTDGGNGPALQIHWADSDCNSGHCQPNNGWVTSSIMSVTNSDAQGTVVPSNAYFEVTMRYDTPAAHRTIDTWSLHIQTGGGAGLEWDGIEVYEASTNSSSFFHNAGQNGLALQLYQSTGNGCCNTCPTCSGDVFPNGIDVTQYHKYAWRVTSDGSTDGWWCNAIDDKVINCDTWRPTSQQLTGGWPTSLAISVGPSNNVVGSGDYNVWIRGVKIYSCAAANSGAHCYTSAPNPPLQ